MLTKLLKQDFGKYASQAYEMALIPEYTSYPAYFDGIKTKEDFLDRASKAFEQENEEILLFFFDGDFSGWIHYFYLEEDRYLDTVSLSASKGMEQMLDEFLRYIAMKYPDATVYLGFPTENRIALGHLTHRGFTVDEISWNTMLELSSAKSGNAPAVSIVPIRKENFGLFEFLHAQRNGQMYWDSGKILCDIDEWVIFAVLRDNRPIGAIYSKRGRQISEIFGTDYDEGRFDSGLQSDLLQAVIQAHKSDGSRYLIWFCDDWEKRIACDTGFTCIGKYIMVKQKASFTNADG